MGYVETIKPGTFTVDDLGTMPEDGMRYELVDGQLLVDLEVFVAPFDFRPNNRHSLQPDVLVCRCDDAGPKGVERPLLLAVEVLSPSTQTTDLITKRRLYERAGVSAYWIFEPEDAVLTVLELTGGHYVERVFKDDEIFEAGVPFPVRIIPTDLVRRVNRSGG